MQGCQGQDACIVPGQKGLILKRRSQNRDQKNPGVQNAGAFKMNMNVKRK